MVWHIINLNTTRHAISAEFSDKDFSWGISEVKSPVSLVQIISAGSKREAELMKKRMNEEDSR